LEEGEVTEKIALHCIVNLRHRYDLIKNQLKNQLFIKKKKKDK
jgi:hypothetical protein